jgi:hypothetical protein
MNTPTDNQTTSESPSCDAACSPSSLTPETDAKQKLKDIIGDEYVAAEFARRLERERNAYLAIGRKNAELAGDLASDLQRLRSAVRNLRDVQGRHHTQIATERLFALLTENADVDLPDTAAQDSAAKPNNPAVSG